LIFQHNNSRAVCQLARWTVETYGEAARSAAAPAFFQVGSIEIACTRARAEELKRKIGNTKSWGLEAHLIGNEEIKRLVPLMRTDDLFGAFHVPSDVNVKAPLICAAMARHCQDRDALRVFENTPVTAIERANGRVRAVVTPRGRIQTDLVLCAAGIWGPEMSRLAGVSIPLTPMQHLYVRTEAIEALRGETVELRHPIIRDQDEDMYYRQHGEAYGFGSYRHDPLPIDIASVPKRAEAAVLPFTPEHMEPAFQAVRHRMPALADAPIARSFNGIFSFTPDVQSILGETPALRGFWVAEAVWVTHGGGVGRVMAEWLAHGDPGIDLRELDINRFPAHAASKRFILERSCRQYVEVYDIVHPLDPPSVCRNLRLSPWHARLQELGAHFSESAGWERPQWFKANEKLLDHAAFPSGRAGRPAIGRPSSAQSTSPAAPGWACSTSLHFQNSRSAARARFPCCKSWRPTTSTSRSARSPTPRC
jgi:glycine/D-amino acid oxidase-like deaminating enzyme